MIAKLVFWVGKTIFKITILLLIGAFVVSHVTGENQIVSNQSSNMLGSLTSQVNQSLDNINHVGKLVKQ